MRYGRTHGLARDRHTRKGEVDLVRSALRKDLWAGKGPSYEEGQGGPGQFRAMAGGPGPIPWGGPGPAILALRGFCGRVGGPGTPSQSGPGPVSATEEPVGRQGIANRGWARWTWSGKRCGGACGLARDRRTRKGEVDLTNSEQCQVDLVRFRGVDLVRPSWL